MREKGPVPFPWPLLTQMPTLVITPWMRMVGFSLALLHKDRGLPLWVLPKDTKSELGGLFFTTITFVLSAKQGSLGYHFLKSFGIEP